MFNNLAHRKVKFYPILLIAIILALVLGVPFWWIGGGAVGLIGMHETM